ncbi:diguanylate cyclase domain-containing protein [Endozoicomonas sp. SCSIO W0465]|uniref:two-component system response regulator n=1 Tax=Endozoicomonas sp. SCSIO W0465 TaxID=2918516 RepID=UPI0020762A48|nr:diguanylate cyclase [Endozoicomonas sp. SCSIO W0465]USE37551.1 diguanylate cyclase [Endozoicomonas sp. SCSIO W0465]
MSGIETNDKAKILVVDDRPENLLAMDKLLKPLGAEIHKVDSGEKALSEVLAHHFAVILLDVQMPGMDGFETATLLHSNKQTANIPIIFVTAINKDHNYVAKGYQSGAVDYLPKPIVPEILLGKVNVFLQLEAQRLELEQVTKELRWISRKNKLLLDCAGEGIVGVDKEGKITFINPTACELLGGVEEAFLDQHISPFLFDADSGETAQDQWQRSDIYRECLEKGGTIKQSTELINLGQGRFPAEFNIAAIVNSRNSVQGAVFVFQDITERKKMEDQLLRMAKYDSLTGLANRTLFREFLQSSMDRSDRYHNNTAVMFLDLDHFKEINDQLGHDAGDQLLSSVAHRLEGCIRKVDIIARLGGDEFAVVLDDVKNPEDTRTVANKILNALREPHDLGGSSRNVGTSIGIAFYPENGGDIDGLIKAADEAMYAAKNEGRNDFRFYSDLKQ